MSVTQKQQQQQQQQEKDKLPIVGFLDTLAAVASIQERADTLQIQLQQQEEQQPQQDTCRNSSSSRNYEKGSSISSGGSVVTESISAQSSSMNTNSSATAGMDHQQGFISNDTITPSESASNVSNGMFLNNLPRYQSSLAAASKNGGGGGGRTTLTPMIQSTCINSNAAANEYDRILQSEERRRLRNREAAQRYRHKQVERMDELEQRIHQLEQQNEEMRHELLGLEQIKEEMEEILKKRSTNCIHNK
ncbi:hypothetical protein MP638_003340 [Amoeboaphelidium occidentale]|nr:hypothetical protein MP638_003340 [Amoeboaphelidium occidentale]